MKIISNSSNTSKRSLSSDLKIDINAFRRLSKTSNSFNNLKFADMLTELGFNLDDIKLQIPEVNVSKRIWTDFVRYTFTLQNSWRFINLYVINGNVMCNIAYHADDKRTKELLKITKQSDDNGELTSVSKNFSYINFDKMLRFILVDSK